MNPGGSGVEFWHQADYLELNKGTHKLGNKNLPVFSAEKRHTPGRLYTDSVYFAPAGSRKQTPDRRIDTLHFYHFATVTGVTLLCENTGKFFLPSYLGAPLLSSK